MNLTLSALKPEEKATLTLRSVYEKYGYKKYKVSNFEEYSLYLQYKSFLTSEKILSFTDLDGRLLALKPDITLSIIKNTKADSHNCEKAYYIENVYRESKQSNTFKEISQMGLEYLGDINSYAVSEVVCLAKQSLAQISPCYILELGHMGFVTGLLDSLAIDLQVRDQMLGFIKAKSSHELLKAAQQAGLKQNDIERLQAVCSLSGGFNQVLEKAKTICQGEKMLKSIWELEEIYSCVKNGENDQTLKLDLTLLNDTEFYDGVLMAGYLEGIARPVLSGGRYDSMMQKLGKTAGAIGFALYLNELERLDTIKQPYDVDTLILAQKNANPSALLNQVNELINQGQRVRVATEIPPQLSYKQAYRFTEKGLEKC